MRLMRAVGFATLAALASCGGGDGGSGGNPPPPPDGTGPGIGHVFIIVLENKDFDHTFADDSAAPYLAKTLTAQGVFLTQYYGIGHQSLTNYVALVSGQAPNPQTQTDCQFFTDWLPPIGVLDGNGQALGTGCVFPSNVPTVVDQLEEAGLTWKAYMEDMGKDLARDGSATCAHPGINSRDGTQSAAADDQYAARHNPFVYFHSIIDDQVRCDAHVVNIEFLPGDLASIDTTPNYVFITPNLCHDGHDEGCANGEPGGLQSIDFFLQNYVPVITASPAFQKDGLLIITFDEAEVDTTTTSGDFSSCCGEVAGPNSPFPGGIGGGPGGGGGRVGAVMLSPKFTVPPGTVIDTPLNHYGLLGMIELLFGLDPLGFAGSTNPLPIAQALGLDQAKREQH